MRKTVREELKQYYTEKQAREIEFKIFQESNRNYREMVYDLLGKKSLKSDLSLKDDSSFWNSLFYQDLKDETERKILRIKIRPESTKGLYICRTKGCGSDEFYVWTAVTRSGDEGMTHFAKCKYCGNQIRH